jgi:putative transcriptional regulator
MPKKSPPPTRAYTGRYRDANSRLKADNPDYRLRFDNGEMTQQQLADKVGVTRQTIIAIEAGKYAPSLPLAFRIARTFRVSVEDVFKYEDEDT